MVTRTDFTSLGSCSWRRALRPIAGCLAAVVLVAIPLRGTTAAPCIGDCSGDGTVGIDELTTLVTIALGMGSLSQCLAGDPDGSGAVTIGELVLAVLATLHGCDSSTPTATPIQTVTVVPSQTSTPRPTLNSSATPTPTLTPTPTHTNTTTPTATPGLGTRRFSLDPQASALRLIPGLSFSGFQGHLELAAGEPDPGTGLAVVSVTDASEFIFVNLGPFTLCIKPIVPAQAAGVLACNGGFDLGVRSTQDHQIGTVGVEGFTEDDCTAAGGTLEDADAAHPGVCNGPVTVGPSGEFDSGVGALLIAPDSRFDVQGLPAETTIAPGPCAEHGPGTPTTFGFVSGLSRAEIHDSNAVPDNLFQHDERGENFSCANWNQENGPGRLVLSVPAVHGAGTEDLITVFVLED